MSLAELSATARIRSIRRATRFCMVRKEYQRKSLNFIQPLALRMSTSRSTVTGWWMVHTIGILNCFISSIP